MRNREMKANFRNGCLLIGVFLLLFLALLPRSAGAIFDDVGKFHFDRYEITPNIDQIDNSKWKVKLSNTSCATPIQLNLSAFIGGDEISASVNMSSTMDFEIEFRNATLPDYFYSWSQSDWDPSSGRGSISPYSSFLNKDIYLDTSDLASLMSKIPYLGPLATVTFKKQIVGAATAPCIVRGKMTVSAIYKAEGLPNPGARANYNTTIQITSIEPTNTNTTRLCAFVGDLETMQGGFGVIDASIGDIKLGKLGPIIAFNGGIFGGDIATWELEREAWTQTEMQHKSLGENVHSCAETGKPGCAEGTDHVIQETWYDWRAQIHLEIAGYTIWHDDSVLGSSRDRLVKTTRRFHQSLTYNEPVIYTECPHRYYLVPAYVWANRSKTIPLREMTVRPSEPVKEDANVIGLSQDVTNEEGLAYIYLPYKSGKYTLTATGNSMTGSAEMPEDMVKGMNKETDIFVTSSQTRTLTARKEWDIDYEDKDRPESINVLLQAIYYATASTAGGNIIEAFSTWEPVQMLTLNEANNWEASFDPVPVQDPSGKEIHYRIREVPALPEDVESKEEKDRLEWANDNVVHASTDLDHDVVMKAVAEASLSTLLNADDLWKASLDPETFLKNLIGNLFFEKDTVDFEVPAYTSSVGEYVKEHETKYAADYRTEDETTVITNIAMLDMHAMKHWLGFSKNDDRPDSVWLVLLSRVRDEYLSLAGEMGSHMPYTPVFNPLTGASISLGSLLGEIIPFGDLIAQLDPTGILTTSLAAGKAKEDDHWLLSFGVKKYSMLKLPLEFECGEVTSEIIKALIKTLTGIDFPISISLTDGYITVPGKVFFILGDTRGMSNILNIRLSPGDDEDAVAIGGTIWWWNEPENQKQNRPEYVTIVVKDGNNEIARVKVPSQDNGNDSWVWSLRNADLPQGTKLESGKTYTVSEEFPENYPHKNSYMVHVDGHDVINIWAPSRKAVIRKQFEAGVTPREVQARLLDPLGTLLGVPCILNAQNEYTATVTDARLASLDLLSLRAEELSPSSHGFIPAYSAPSISVDKAGVVTFTYTITNRVQKNITVQIEKIWSGDSSGQRPDSVKLLLKRNGTVIARPVLTAGGNWKTSLSKDQNGQNLQMLDDQGRRYLYTLEEESDGSGLEHYRFKVDTAQDQSGNITFTATNTRMETVTLQGIKEWVDSSNSEGNRPASINLSIMGNGVIWGNLTVSAPSGGGNRWSFSAGPLPRYDSDGNEIGYSLLEEPVAAYVPSYADPVFDEATGVWTCNVTNTLESNSRNITVTKVWVDEEASPVRKYLRPDSVKVMLYGQAPGSDIKHLMNTVVLSKENGWTHTFYGLRKYDKPGVEINYTVEEEPVPGYVCAVTGSVDAGFTLTNTYSAPQDDSSTLMITKTWEDNENQKGIRPDSVTVRIMQTTYGKENEPWKLYQKVVLSPENNWSAVLTNIPARIPNPPDPHYYMYEYEILEDPVPGYTYIKRRNDDVGFTRIEIVNSVTDETVETRDIKVNKVWSDNNNAQQARPAQITLLLRDDQHNLVRRMTVDVTSDNMKVYTFNNVPRKRDGVEIEYRVEEEPIEGYESQVQGNMNEDFTVCNTFMETGRIVVTKSWDDGKWNTPASMERPAEVKVVLKQGSRISRKATLSEENNWTFTFDRLIANGLAQYTVEEQNVPAEYTVNYIRGEETVSKGVHTLPITITNTRAFPQKAKYTISKVWRLPDGTKPGWPENKTVTFFLLANGSIVNQTVLSADHQTHTFTDLPALEGENWIDYEIVEQSADGYVSEEGKKEARTEADGTVHYTQTFTNTYNPTFNIRVTKQWNHGQNPSHPKSVRIIVSESKTDQMVEGGEVTLSEENNWTHTFQVPAYSKENIIAHYIVEERVGSPRYKAAWNPPQVYERGKGICYQDATDGEYALTVTNTYQPGNEDYKVIINWEEGPYSELKEYRPDSVKVYLTLNGQKTDKYITVTGNKTDKYWNGTFSATALNLDPNVYYDGVVEDSIPGYIVSSSGQTAPYTFQITNTAQAVIYRVEKKWQNAKGQPEVPDKRVYVSVHNGKTGEMLALVSLEKSNGYTRDIIVPLILDENGNEIIHYVEEHFLSRSDIYKYIVTYSQPEPFDSMADRYYFKRAYRVTITNRTASDNRDFIIRKEWRLREGGPEPSKYPSWFYTLYADGVIYGEKQGVYGKEVTMSLPATRNGVPIVYTVEENDIPEDCVVTYEDITDAQGQIIGCKIINTQIGYLLPVKGAKTWNDNDNALGLRPDSITIRLLQDGKEIANKTVSSMDGWSWNFGAVDPVYTDSDYKRAIHTYSIAEDPVPRYDAVIDGFNVTNTIQTVSYTVTKQWVEAEGYAHPDHITVSVLDEDSNVVASAELKASENWTHTFANLPRYGEDGYEIWYTFREETIPGYTSYYLQDEYRNITLVNVPSVSIQVRKVWQTEGEHPDRLVVYLYANNALQDSLVLDEKTGWTGTFVDLPILDQQASPQPINYTVREEALSGFYCTENVTSGPPWQKQITLTNTPYDPITVSIPVRKTVACKPADLTAPEETFTITLMPILKIDEQGNPVFDEDHQKKMDIRTTGAGNYDIAFQETFSTTGLHLFQIQESVSDIPGYICDADPRMLIVSVYQKKDAPAGTLGTEMYMLQGETQQNSLNPRIPVDAEHPLTFTNFYVGTRNESVSKVWDDDDAIWRPEAVTVRLQAQNDDSLFWDATLNADNGWSHTFTNLPVYYPDDHVLEDPIIYEVTELNTPVQYEASVTKDQNGFILTNTLRSINIRVNKIWNDNDNALGDRPETVPITLRGDGANIATVSLTPDSSGTWTYLFEDLPQYEDHGDGTVTEIEYDLHEFGIPGYITNNPADYTYDSETKTGTFTLTNTRVTTDIPVAKYWLDEKESYPAVTFILYSNWESEDTDKEVARLTLTEADSDPNVEGSPWKGRFTNLPVATVGEGRVIRYTLKEMPVEGYDEPLIRKNTEQEDDGSPYIHTSFDVYNFPESTLAAVYVVKQWVDDDDAKGIRPRQVITHLRNGDEELMQIILTGEDGNFVKMDDLPLIDEEGRRIDYTLREDEVPGYDSAITLEKVDFLDRKLYIFIVKNTLREDACVLTYDPNGGILEGSKESLQEIYRRGTTVKIHTAPEREGYIFQYWKGSEYVPGDEYIVTEDHTFVAQWLEEDPENFRFTFTKRWSGQPQASIEWTLYDEEGNVLQNYFDRKVVSDQEWQYTAWFAEPGDYYVIEKTIPGYETIYQNVGEYADVTDRCYTGGTITNVRQETCLLTYDPNGGVLDGDMDPLLEEHLRGTTVKIHQAPERVGYIFQYWKGSEYLPGDEYTVTEDHTFVAQWLKEQPENFRFTFTKRWSGQPQASIDWTLYDGEGNVLQNHFDRKVVSDDEWQYTAWFAEPGDYYIIEKPIPGYETIYQNVGEYEDVTDRCYTGGTITNVRQEMCLLTYDPNGGVLDGDMDPLLEEHPRGTTVRIHHAPERVGYIFQYWKGSEYLPGDEYTVTEDHTFVAQWLRVDPLNFKFSFTKRWSGTPQESIDWTLYNEEGNVVRKMFNKKIASDYEWQYTGWFAAPGDYYIIEKPVPDYETSYQNVGKYADVTDRCYNGGTIINYRLPDTGDESRLILWGALGGAAVLLLIVMLKRRR